jgi:type IV secretion system protein VirB9
MKPTTQGSPRPATGLVALAACTVMLAVAAGPASADALTDRRIRVREYGADVVYRLRGYVGYQIDLEFEPGESFVGLGAGDLDSITFAAQENHLFLKPRAAGIETNLTVLTNRRTYHFDYVAGAARPDPTLADMTYALRFSYPQRPAASTAGDGIESTLARAAAGRVHNLDYGYCGSDQLKPQSAWDDGVQTHLRFGSRQELPAVFVRNDDGSESLVNFTIEADEMIVHRVARRFSVRRGRLRGCIVNESFTGAGQRLESGTVTPAVERVTRGAQP